MAKTTSPSSPSSSGSAGKIGGDDAKQIHFAHYAKSAKSAAAPRLETEQVDPPPPQASHASEPDPQPNPQPALAFTAEDLARRADAFAASDRAKNTRRSYSAGWAHFTAWCAETSPPATVGSPRTALPATAETVRLYLAAHGEGERMLRAVTLKQRLAAITFYHREAGFEPPTRADAVRRVLEGIVRTQVDEGIVTQKATPLLVPDLRRLIEALPLEGTDALWPLRDRALLLVGWAGGFRRSALKSLNMADVEAVDEGMIVTIRRDKTDQKGGGRAIGIRYGAEAALCPVRAYEAWTEALATAADIRQGAIFREITRHGKVEGRLSDRGVARIVKRAVYRAGYDPDLYSGHSLRRGLVTAARRAGVDRLDIARATGHKSMSVLDGYIEQSGLFDDTPASKAGL